MEENIRQKCFVSLDRDVAKLQGTAPPPQKKGGETFPSEDGLSGSIIIGHSPQPTEPQNISLIGKFHRSSWCSSRPVDCATPSHEIVQDARGLDAGIHIGWEEGNSTVVHTPLAHKDAKGVLHHQSGP